MSLVKNDRLTEVDQSKIKRVGMVIKIKEDKIEEYLELHSDSVGGSEIYSKNTIFETFQFYDTTR